MEIALVIGLLLLAIALFSTGKIPVDIVSLTMLIILTLSGTLTSREAFAAFGSDFIIMLASIFVITQAIETSGILDVLSDAISKTRAAQYFPLLLWLLPFCGIVSAFMNNTTLTALLVSPLLSLSRKSKINPSRLLMPMSFATIVGGTMTLLGTSTNIAVSGYLAKEGFGHLGIFDVTPIGVCMLLVLILYMLTIGRWLLPDRVAGEMLENYQVREYMSEMRILPGSGLIGRPVQKFRMANSDFGIISIIRNDQNIFPNATTNFEENDLVLINASVKDLLAVKDKSGIDIVADTLEVNDLDKDREKLHLREVLIPANSELNGKTVKATDFRNRYGLVIVAVNRAGHTFNQKIGTIELRGGDLLLVQGTPKRLANFYDQHNLIFLEEHEINPRRNWQVYATLALFAGAILLSSVNVLPPEIAFLSAALCMVFLKIVKPYEAYQNINWQALVLIAGMSAFGTAMKNSGADIYISNLVISLFESYGPHGIMLGFMTITVLLTQPMSNAAAALVVLPIALKSAAALHVNPITFGVAVMLSASVSIITPFEPSCLLIYGPGKYKFHDFIKVGGLLTLVLMAVIYFLTPVYFPL